MAESLSPPPTPGLKTQLPSISPDGNPLSAIPTNPDNDPHHIAHRCQTQSHLGFRSSAAAMASVFSLPKHALPAFPSPCPKASSSFSKTHHHLPILSKSSHFFGLRVPCSSSLPPSSPSSSSPPRSPVCAKVSKGDVPPSFTLKNQDGKNVSLSSYKGKPVVVYFYPADETPGCTKEACAFRDSYEKFKKAGAEVIGISGDDPSSHKAFAKKYRLPFTLLSDEGNKVRKEWGVPSDLFGTLPGRQTYVIDKKGVVQLVYNNQFQPEKHVDETLKLLQSL